MDLPNLIIFATEEVAEHSADAGVVGTLGLNAKLFIAQLINFSVVLFILWKWVFKPVGGALEKRRKKIDDSLKKAEDLEVRMQNFEKERQEEIAKARRQAEEIVQNALKAADEAKVETVEAARKEAEKVLADAKQAIMAEREEVFREVRREVAEITVMAAEKILKAKIDPQKDKQLIEESLNLK